MINEDVVRKIAELARLQLSDAEVKAFGPQLTSILKAFEKLENVDTRNVEPLLTPSDIQFRPRVDELKTDASGSEATLSNAPERSGNLFKVPPVV